MEQLVIHVKKNATIQGSTFSPNVVLLAKESGSSDIESGEVTRNVRYIEVCKVEKTEALYIVQSLLKYCIAEFYVCNELEKDFKDTNIKQRKLFNQFLNSNIIYRTDSTGKVANALVSEIPFNQTALNVKNYHTITTCQKENLKAAIYQHSKAILAQCKYLRMILNKAEDLDAQLEATPQKASKKPAKSQQKAITSNTGTAITTAVPAA